MSGHPLVADPAPLKGPIRLIRTLQLRRLMFAGLCILATTASGQESPVANRATGGSAVPVHSVLQGIWKGGGVPKTLEDFRRLERQQKSVARTASASTVSVQIGPAQGCGVIVTESGYILTAAHVASRTGKTARITLSDGRVVNATTLGMKRSVDAGLIKIDRGQNGGRPWPHASLGTSAKLRAGMWVIATGHPGGYKQERGPVTRVGRILDVRPDALVTDCALIGGDSGGPLFDLSGRLIAVHSRIGNDVADNLHVPVDHYNIAWDRLASGESWGVLPGFKPRLGVRGNDSTGVAQVLEVTKGSPAEKGGIELNDVIEQFGETKITNFASLKRAVSETYPGERVTIWLVRQGKRRRVQIEIGRSD